MPLVLILESMLGAGVLLLAVPVLVLFLEVLLAASRKSPPPLSSGRRPRLAVLMPAHDEALVIARTLRSLKSQLTPSDRLLVVADNCSDDTAKIARSEGAEVAVRTHHELRGKSYALDFGVSLLRSAAPEVVIIVDADCEVHAGAIETLAHHCLLLNRPIQALYLMRSGAHAGLNLKIAELAWIVKNQVRPSGLWRAGLPCQLMGTGMAFPWPLLSTAQLATGHLVEDLKLGVDLAKAGSPPAFCPQALVSSEFPLSAAGARSQRTRWEHGHLSVIQSEVPSLLIAAVRALDPKLVALALDLSVPPLALLTIAVGMAWLLSLGFMLATRLILPLAVACVSLLMLAASILLAWRLYARHVLSLGSLLKAPAYALRKLPLYARFIISRQTDWVRSARDKDER